jgi:hypothetical protein
MSVASAATLPSVDLAAGPVVEWTLAGGEVLSATSAQNVFGATGVTLDLRATATGRGLRYDVRLRNHTSKDYRHGALRVRLPRAGTDAAANVEGQTVALPAELKQRWVQPMGATGAKYGFAYEIFSGSQLVRREGPSSDPAKWGGRASGIVRVDAKAYAIPEFWERQPRSIRVTQGEIVLTLFEGANGHDSTTTVLRAGEDAWDRFAIIDAGTLSNAEVAAEAEGLPSLGAAERKNLMLRFGVVAEGLRGADSQSEAWLRKYDQWQGTPWDPRYADANAARGGPINDNTGKTTLFTLFANGGTYPANSPGIYTWRDYGDIPWGDGMSALHYDWLRAAFKHYLRTGNVDALRWGMAAMRQAITVDFQWNDTFVPGDAGFARYEKGDHGLADFPGRPSHTWGEGLFLAAAITQDPWVRDAAVRRAEGTWNYFGGASAATWDGAYGELRWITWPLLLQARAFLETNDGRYWVKAKELMAEILRAEQLSGGKGYIKNYAYASLNVGYPNTVSSLQHGYAVRPLLEFADVAKARGEWTPAHQQFLLRLAQWTTTPMPEGPYVPSSGGAPGKFYGDEWCPPGSQPAGCALNPDGSDSFPLPLLNVSFDDLYAWLSREEPQNWSAPARAAFRDAMTSALHPDGIVGYLTDEFPGSESKVLGKAQLFGERAAAWLANAAPPPPPGLAQISLAADSQSGALGARVRLAVNMPGGVAGTVIRFSDGGAVLGAQSLPSNLMAEFVTAPLRAGRHEFVAAYDGGLGNGDVRSNAVAVQVAQGAVSVSVESSKPRSTYGDAVSLTATVAGNPAFAPEGSVTFRDGAATLGTVSVSGGRATLVTGSLSNGRHTIVASYLGDHEYTPAQSPALLQEVSAASGPQACDGFAPRGTVTKLADFVRNPVYTQQRVALVASVQGHNAGGIVQFYDQDRELGSAQLSSGFATLTVQLRPGEHALMARYLGDGCNMPSDSATGRLRVRAGQAPQDFNGDGKTDLLGYRPSDQASGTWLMDGPRILASVAFPGVDEGFELVAPGDFHGDGTWALLWFRRSDGALGIRFADAWVQLGNVPPEWTLRAIADIDGDGKADLVFFNAVSGAHAIAYISDEAITRIEAGEGGQGFELLGAADFDGGGKAKLLWSRTADGMLAIAPPDGSPVPIGQAPLNGEVRALADIDGDGTADIVWFHADTRTVTAWSIKLGAVSGTIALGSSPAGSRLLGAADLNGDGKADLLWYRTADRRVSVKLTDGQMANIGTLEPGWEVRGVGDFPLPVARTSR